MPARKMNGLIKLSGDGIKSEKALKELKNFSKKYSTVVIIGGGTNISAEFEKKGFEIKFCPLGRITESLEEKKLAIKILKKNQKYFQNFIDAKGIRARVEIPGRNVGSVLCPENGDTMVLSAYLGFDKIIIFTRESNIKAKKLWLEKVAKVFGHIEKGKLDKIEIRGF